MDATARIMWGEHLCVRRKLSIEKTASLALIIRVQFQDAQFNE
ncbi:MAG: hypothetical protein ACI9VS_001373 [Candidatus Binatia bacterium]|jgi:hypothetical protein